MNQPAKLLPLLFVLLLLLGSCTVTQSLQDNSSGRADYTLLFIIHGDAGYSYHLNGKKYEADKQALKRAQELGGKAGNGEVLIFHLRPEKKRFFFFPAKDRMFYHYRNGRLVEKRAYSPEPSGLLTREAGWYREKKAAGDKREVLLYFGHEIPTFDIKVYNQSQPEKEFNIRDFTNSLYLFGGDFDLTILSTCNNGNPLTARLISEQSDFMVASPQNLHLSHLRPARLHLLETQPDIPTRALADSVARHSFEVMDSYLQTMITIGAYDLNTISNYIESLSAAYEEHLLKADKPAPFEDNVDCKDLGLGEGLLKTEGIKLYFKAPAFGRKAGMQNHSGWGCIKGN